MIGDVYKEILRGREKKQPAGAAAGTLGNRRGEGYKGASFFH